MAVKEEGKDGKVWSCGYQERRRWSLWRHAAASIRTPILDTQRRLPGEDFNDTGVARLMWAWPANTSVASYWLHNCLHFESSILHSGWSTHLDMTVTLTRPSLTAMLKVPTNNVSSSS
ncbi:uncharacterized protein [Rhodnius prolixus]|uniref:uncharacterized protein n=1 Tax=Rhodnius prolixus TaxID=13249 RepID=UPI003D189DE4